MYTNIKEYLSSKEKENTAQQNRKTIQDCFINNQKIPIHLRPFALKIMDEIIYDCITTSVTPFTLLLTTSRNPSSRLKQFTKSLSLLLNGSVLQRGNLNLTEISENLFNTCLLIIEEVRGVPSTLIFSFFPYGPTFHFTIINFKMTNRIRKYKKNCYLVLDGFTTDIGKRVFKMFQLLFPAVENAKRLLLVKNIDDVIYFRHFFVENVLVNDCLQFGLRLFKISKGVYGSEEEDWVLNNFINRKQNVL